MIKKLFTFLLTANISSDDYKIAKEDMHKNNVTMLRVLSSISTSIFLLCAVLGLFVSNMHPKLAMYLTGLALSAMILAEALFSKNEKIHSFCMYAFDILLLSVGLSITLVGAPQQLTVTLIPVALLVPLFFDTQPYRFLIVVLSADLIYLIFAPVVKPADILVMDMVDVFAFSLAGILIGTILTKIKVERYVYAHNVERAAIYDNLTGLLNRRAYSQDTKHLTDVYPENFVYISLDVNGLKVVNDTIGHAAGDEIIEGASQCMSRCFYKYGKVYRTGGDEFVAILYIPEDRLEEVINNFQDEVACWHGELVDKLAVSLGYVKAKDIQGVSFHDVSVLADEKMYEDKAAYYKRQGIDRRGQIEAHTALCNLYTKILKINITDDTYRIISMDVNEQTREKGFSNTISSWLIEFGKSGSVHPDDLEEYLSSVNLEYIRNYFLQDKNSLSVFYRRKYGDVYKNVMMEIIPAGDYTDSNQSLFLYVKEIDK